MNVAANPLQPAQYQVRSTAPEGAGILYGVLSLLLLVPLAFGATEPWSIFLLEFGSDLLFIFWGIQQIRRRELTIHGNPLFLPMAGFGVVVVLQLVTGRTAYGHATFSTGLLWCAYGMLSFLTVQALRTTRQLRFLAEVITVYGAGVAIFALIQSLTSNGKIYWVRRVPAFSGIYGPYANHNHYAGLMEMLLPVPLVAALSQRLPNSRRALAAIAAAIMASTIFLSGSRAGMLVFLLQMMFLISFLIWQKRRKATLLLLFFASAVVLLIMAGASDLPDRLASIHPEAAHELAGGTRLAIDRDCLRMFAAKPLLGWGLGTFPEIYPQYRSFYTSYEVDRAHNDYLELLVETGAAGLAILLWFMLVLFRSAWKKIQAGPLRTNNACALAAMLAVNGILLHSFLDFNLQIPANALLFSVFCALAAGKPLPRHNPRELAGR